MIQVYMGNGKGKTTAAFGLALRSSGAGLKVFIGQFCKKGVFSEVRSVRGLPGVTVEQFGAAGFIASPPKKRDVLLAQRGLRRVLDAVCSGAYDMVVLDEVLAAVSLGLISHADLTGLIKRVPRTVELVLTGRRASPGILRRADLVSCVVEVKHYFRNGVKARRGIEY